jgi:predicted amino acid-binding ACT domain protein
MAQIGDLSVTIKIDGANKAVQDLEKVRRQLELISNLARNTAASFATFNTQLRQFSAASSGLAAGFNAGAQSATKFNYAFVNTARIIKDFTSGNARKGFGDALQTLAATNILSGRLGFNTRGLGPGATVGNALQQAALKTQYDAMQSDVLRSLAESNLGKKLFPGMTSVSRMATATGNLYSPGYLGGTGLFNYAGRLTQNVTSASNIFSAITKGLGTKFAPGGIGGFLGGNMNLFRVGLSALGIGAIIGVFSLLKTYMISLSQAVLKASQSLGEFAMKAVEQAAEFQSIRSQNISGIIGSQFGGQYNPSTLSQARAISAKQFDFMRKVAEKSVYTLPEMAGAANILTTAGIPLNKFLETTALTGQASGLRGREVELVARMFSRLAFGDFPDPEVGARFGLVRSNPRLKQLGMTFDKSGQMTTGSTQAVNIVQKFLRERFGSGFLISANDFNTKFATLADKFATILEKIGTPIMNSLIPVFNTLSHVIDGLVSKGVLERLGGSISLFFDTLNTYLASPDFRTHAAFFFAVLEEIPNQLSNMFNFFGKFLTKLIGAAEEIAKGGPWRILGEALLNIGTMGASSVAKLGVMAYQSGFMDFAAGQFAAPETIMLNFERYKAMLAGPGYKKKTVDLPESPFKGPDINKNLDETAKNTKQLVDINKKMFDIFDMRRQTIGLGAVGKFGVTGPELAAMGMPFTESRGISIGPITGYSLRHPGTISPGPVRGTNKLEQGIKQINRESSNTGRTGRGIRTSR